MTEKKLSKFEREKLERLTEQTKLVNASELMQALRQAQTELTPKEKDILRKALKINAEKTGNSIIERAILQKIISEEEVQQIFTNFKFSASNLGTILSAVMHRKTKNQSVKVLTLRKSKIYQHRNYFKSRFDIDIIDEAEFMKLANNKSYKRERHI